MMIKRRLSKLFPIRSYPISKNLTLYTLYVADKSSSNCLAIAVCFTIHFGIWWRGLFRCVVYYHAELGARVSWYFPNFILALFYHFMAVPQVKKKRNVSNVALHPSLLHHLEHLHYYVSDILRFYVRFYWKSIMQPNKRWLTC